MLESIKVLAFTHYLQGPLAAQMLGDLGAEVIKIEPLDGAFERHWSGMNVYRNGVSINYLLGNRSQKSLSVDLKTEEGKEIIRRLAQEADILIENFRPGVMERLGFGYEKLKEENPGLIYCSCSGFGSDGPYKDRPGQDLLVQAMSGLMTQSGRQDDPPMALGAAVVDCHAAVLSVLGILGALYEKLETGIGKHVESNLLDASLDLQVEPFNIYLNGFPPYERSASGISSRIGQAPYGVFETADGYLCLSMNPLDKLAEIFEDPTFLQWVEEGQFVRREEINVLVVEHMRKHTNAYWIQRLEQFGAWFALIEDYDDLEKNPQVQWNGCFYEMEHPEGWKARFLAHPVRYNDKTIVSTQFPPDIGAHTEEILQYLQYTPAEIEDFIRRSIVRSSRQRTGE